MFVFAVSRIGTHATSFGPHTFQSTMSVSFKVVYAATLDSFTLHTVLSFDSTSVLLDPLDESSSSSQRRRAGYFWDGSASPFFRVRA